MTPPAHRRSTAAACTTAIARLGWLTLTFLTGIAAPYAVWRVVGWPLPHHLPTAHQVETTLTTRYPDTGIYLDVVTCLFWYIWLSVALAVPAELAATLRGRPRPHLPLPGPGQALAAALIGGILLTGARHRPPTPATARIPTPATFRAVATAPQMAPAGPFEITLAAASTPADAAATTSYQVKPGDTLWGIAAAHLGDPMRYRDLAALNHGRLQPDGATFTDPNDITPGWTLLIPTDTTSPAPTTSPAGAATVSPTSPRHTVAPGDSLWTIAARHYPHLDTTRLPDAARAIYTANEGLAADTHGDILDDPDVISPGMVLRLPTIPATPASSPGQTTAARPFPGPEDVPAPGEPAAPSAHSPTAPPTAAPGHSSPTALPDAGAGQIPGSPPHTAARPSSPAPATTPGQSGRTGTARPARPAPTMRATPVHHRDHHDDLLPLWVASAGLLAAGVALTAASRRRRRDLRVGTDSAPPPPDPTVVDLHTGILSGDGVGGAARLDAAVRALAARHRDEAPGSGPRPQVLLQRVDGTVDAFLNGPSPDAPPPWRAEAEGRIWVLSPTGDLGDDLPDITPPCPALVQLGTTQDGSALYADLEALGVLTLDGGPEGASGLRGLARAIVVTIALSPLAAMPTVRTYGFDPLGLADDERVDPARSIAVLARDTTDDAGRVTAALDTTDASTTFAARARHPHDNWDPVIAVVAADLDDLNRHDLADLARLAGDGGRGLALVAPAHPDIPASWSLTLVPSDPIGWRLDPLGLVVTPVTLAAEELRDLTALLDDADQPPIPLQPPPPDPEPAPFIEPPWQVMIRLIGPLDAVGRDGQTADRALARERTLEVLAWLAAHRGRTRSDLEAALWPRGIQARSMNNQISRARRILTDLAGDDAQDWIPLDRTKISMNPAVITDLDLIRLRLDHATAQRDHPDNATATLTPVLDLLRGAPQPLPWLQAELGSELTTTAVAAALLLAELHLTHGDTDTVLSVTTRGLTVLPGHPGLFALRMRGRAAAGDRAAVRTEYDAYLRAEQADPFYDGDTDRDLEQLFHTLTRERTSTSPPPS